LIRSYELKANWDRGERKSNKGRVGRENADRARTIKVY